MRPGKGYYGEEGYADVRVLEGVLRALKTGTAQTLEPFQRSKRSDPSKQSETLAAQRSPELAGASNPARGQEKNPKN